MLYGISAGPLRSERARRLSAWIARRSAVATCRDQVSADLLREIDPHLSVEVHPDPVLGLEPAPDARFEQALELEKLARKGSRPRLAIAQRDLDFLDFDGRILIGALRELARDYELLFVPQGTGRDRNDRLIAKAIMAEIGAPDMHSLEHRHAPDVLMRFYETADVTLAARLHGAVFSARVGTPVAGLAYLPKVSSFLEAVGLGDHCVGIREATPDLIVSAVACARQVDRAAVRNRAAGLARGVSAYIERASALLDLSATDGYRRPALARTAHASAG